MPTNSPLTINTAEIDLAALRQAPGAQAFLRLHDGTLPPPIATRGDGTPVMAAGRGELEPQPPLSPQEQFDLMAMTYGLGSPELLRFVAAVKRVCSAAGTGGKKDNRFDLNNLTEAHSIAEYYYGMNSPKGASVDDPVSGVANRRDIKQFMTAVQELSKLLETVDSQLVPAELRNSVEFVSQNDSRLGPWLIDLRKLQHTARRGDHDVVINNAHFRDISIAIQKILDYCRLVSYALKVHTVDEFGGATVERGMSACRLHIFQNLYPFSRSSPNSSGDSQGDGVRTILDFESLLDLHQRNPALFLPPDIPNVLKIIHDRFAAALAGYHSLSPQSVVDVRGMIVGFDDTADKKHQAIKRFLGDEGKGKLFLLDAANGLDRMPHPFIGILLVALRQYILEVLKGDRLLIATQNLHPYLQNCRSFEDVCTWITALLAPLRVEFTGGHLPNIHQGSSMMNADSFLIDYCTGFPDDFVQILRAFIGLNKTRLSELGINFPA